MTIIENAIKWAEAELLPYIGNEDSAAHIVALIEAAKLVPDLHATATRLSVERAEFRQLAENLESQCAGYVEKLQQDHDGIET